MQTLHFTLVTPEKKLLSQEVDSVTLNTEAGQITVLAKHTSLVTIVKPGECIVKIGQETIPFALAGGVAEISQNKLTILADTAEHAHDIDVTRAETRARELTERLAAKEKLDITTYKTMLRQLEKEQVRLGVSKKWKK